MRSFLFLAVLGFSFSALAKTTCTVAVTSTSSAQALAANKNRARLILQNNSAEAITITFDAVQSGAEGIILVQNSILQFYGDNLPVGAIFAKAASNTPSISFCETTK